MLCPYCRETIDHSYLKTKVICQACYLYTQKGGSFHAIPDSGVVVKDEEGKVVCHICGQAHTKLGNHIYAKHNMSIADYKDHFDIPQNVSLASSTYQDKMRRYNMQHKETVVYNNLINHGSVTRYQPGQVPARKHNRKKKITIVSLANADTVSEN